MKTVYELRHFKSSDDRNLTRALVIYSQNIEPILRTDTREIIYWLDNYNKQFNDRFCLLGLFQNDELVGFAQLAYFIEEKVVFVDYIVIEKVARKNNTFYEFIDQIREFLSRESMQFDYIVGEVGYFNESKEPTEATRNLVRLLKMSGFGVVKTSYYQPMLGKNNYESELQSVLMIYTPSDLKAIKKETFIMIIETIYYKHYKRWFDKFFTEKESSTYNSGLNKLFEKIGAEIKKKTVIEINGYSNLFPSSVDSKKVTGLSIVKLFGVIAVFLMICAIVGTLVVFLKRQYNLDEKSLTFISVATIVVIIFSSKLLYNNNESIATTMEKIAKIFK